MPFHLILGNGTGGCLPLVNKQNNRAQIVGIRQEIHCNNYLPQKGATMQYFAKFSIVHSEISIFSNHNKAA